MSIARTADAKRQIINGSWWTSRPANCASCR